MIKTLPCKWCNTLPEVEKNEKGYCVKCVCNKCSTNPKTETYDWGDIAIRVWNFAYTNKGVNK